MSQLDRIEMSLSLLRAAMKLFLMQEQPIPIRFKHDFDSYPFIGLVPKGSCGYLHSVGDDHIWVVVNDVRNIQGYDEATWEMEGWPLRGVQFFDAETFGAFIERI